MRELTKKRSALLRWTAVLTGVAVALTLGTAPAQAAPDDPPTVVSLTFDDGNDDQQTAVDLLNQYGMKGTFFITTGFIDNPSWLTRGQLTAIAAAGHEIGGHAVTHPDLTTVSAEEAKRQVCESRATLAEWGFPTRSFAYPFAATNAAVKAVTADCGFNSGRQLGDIDTRFSNPATGTTAESIPPADAFETKAADQVSSSWTLQDMQDVVTNAENSGGGWVQLTFHHLCATGCDPSLTTTPEIFQAFLAWLQPRAAAENTTVKTVGDVVGGAVKPLIGSTFPPAPGPGVNGVINPSLETPGTEGLPQCWAKGGFGENNAVFSTVATARTGTAAAQLTVSNRTSGDAKLIVTQDLGTCAPTVTPGQTYSLRAWYTSTVPTQFDVYLRSGSGTWSYLTSSPQFNASPTYAQATWTTAVIPAGTTGISFGLNLIENGTLVTDDYALYNTVGAPGTVDIVAGTPTITGTAQVGSTLTAVPGTWTPASTTLAYQWLSAGTDIPGATATTYAPVAADVGKAISVRVTGSSPGLTSVSAVSAATAAVTAATTTLTTGRLAGPNAYDTAVEVSKAEFAPGVARLYVATGAGYHDALSAAPAAARFNSPVLLTQPGSIPAVVQAEVTRLQPVQIVVAGGPLAVSDAVLAQLKTLAPSATVSRVFGANAYNTSQAIATDAFGTGASDVYIATGLDFPDALTAAPAAAHFKGPILLVPGTSGTLDSVTSALLTSLGTTTVRIAGGPLAVSTGIENALKAKAGVTTVKRNGGANMYGTAAAINQDAFTTSRSTAYLAVGTNFPDALVGAALAGSKDVPLYLTPSTCVDTAALADFKRLGTTKVWLLGGPLALSDSVARLVPCG